jgi:hypothetical protein
MHDHRVRGQQVDADLSRPHARDSGREEFGLLLKESFVRAHANADRDRAPLMAGVAAHKPLGRKATMIRP